MESDAAAQELVQVSDQLHQLGDLLSRLNFFRAAGLTWSEHRHSDFLAFLLSPTESHRLGDKFLKQFLQQMLLEHGRQTNLSLEELSDWKLDDTIVRREEQFIDILLLNLRLGFAVIIENKTGSQEHGDQLKRYWDYIESKSRLTPRVLGLFLSPLHTAPSDSRYLPISYRMVHKALEQVRRTREVSGNRELSLLLGHYSELLEGAFMEHSQAANIAWEIYCRHPKVVEYLNANDPVRQIKNEIKVLISETAGCSFEAEKHAGSELSFVLSDWRKESFLIAPPIEYSTAWLFWFNNFRERVVLWLGADPGNQRARTKLIQVAQSGRLQVPPDGIGRIEGDWPTIWSMEFLNEKDLLELSRDKIFPKIREGWQKFRNESLPLFIEALTSKG